MKIAIIGAGISGLIAEGAFAKDPDNEITIFDHKKTSHALSGHKAVMRLRNDKIKNFIDCKLKKIAVYKAVYHEGKIYDKPNILLNNLYSLKAYGSLGERSLLSLGRVERYLIGSFNKQSLITKAEVKRIDKRLDRKGALVLSGDNFQFPENFFDYDICISTMPMPLLLRAIDGSYNVEFKYIPIYVNTALLKIKSDVHQTLYFTNRDKSVPYRVTIEGDQIIAESIEPITGTEFNKCLNAFGLSWDHIDSMSFTGHEQKMGKLSPIDDDVRRKIMMDLTDKYNIYSFGRFATWRSLRIDQTLEDIEKIKMFIRIKSKGYYSDHV